MYMSVLTVTEARAKLPLLIDQIQAGQNVILTRHGEPVAVMISPDVAMRYRNAAIWGQADSLLAHLEEAAKQPLAAAKLTSARADELVSEIRAERDAT